MKKDADEFYIPLIKKDIQIDGIAGETIPNGKSGLMIQKKFINSLQEDFSKLANNIVSFAVKQNAGNSLNELLVIIKKNHEAKIYYKFPISLKIRSKVDVKKGDSIGKRHVADIETIEFLDADYKINIEEGDKIIWLFRVDWRMGIYFDFSGKLTPDNLNKELGICYRSLLFYNLYSFLEDQSYFDLMLKDGWFPFIQLTDENFDKLSQYYLEDSKYEIHIENLLKEFSKERIDSITKYWWSNPVFNSKKSILEAGILAYLQDDKQGYIHCIKTLLTEAEGIIRFACFNEDGTKKMGTEDLKDYITNKGLSKFSSVGSLGFPKLFYDYLADVVFKGFNIDEEISTSRHSVAHGVAKFDNYTKIRAFQMILILDQIYFFLGKQ